MKAINERGTTSPLIHMLRYSVRTIILYLSRLSGKMHNSSVKTAASGYHNTIFHGKWKKAVYLNEDF